MSRKGKKMKQHTIARTFISIIIMAVAMPGLVEAGDKSKKPRPPIQVTISPVPADVTADAVKPGDVVEFKIDATAMVDTTDMRIQIRLAGGAELVSGSLSWTGPAIKNEIKTLLITVKAPQKGNGAVKAKLSITLSGDTVFTTSSEYVLGVVKKPKPGSARPVRKDSKGHDVIEYR